MKRLTRQNGLTLVELLVTMVIFGFVIATLSGALSQISQMMRISSEQTNGFLGRWSHSRALHDIIGNMVLDPTLEEPFVGTAGRIELVSLTTLHTALGKPERLRITLEQDIRNPRHTDLKVISLTPDPEGRPDADAAQWVTRFEEPVEFSYLDQQQEAHREWPPSHGLQKQKLPTAVLVQPLGQAQPFLRLSGYGGPVNPANSVGRAMLGQP